MVEKSYTLSKGKITVDESDMTDWDNPKTGPTTIHKGLLTKKEKAEHEWRNHWEWFLIGTSFFTGLLLGVTIGLIIGC